ncbi:TonB family protein [Pontibacter sp. HJ8]
MHRDNRHILWGPEGHPSLVLLQQYQEDTLPPALHHQLEQHLLDCVLCSDVLEGMAVTDAARTDAAEKDLNRRIASTFRSKKRKTLPVYLTDWRVAAALVLVFCSTVLVFYYNYREITQQKQGIAAATDKAIQEAMDLSEAAADVPEQLADAVPDTVRQTIAATAPAALPKRRALAKLPPRQEEVPTMGPVLDAAVIELKEAAIPETSGIARTHETAESVTATAYQDRSTFVPETTSVARALQGKVAGVRLKGTNAAASVAGQQVQGQVLSSDGQPLPGVAVTVKGTRTGVATDAQGNFSLQLPVDKATLVFGFIGYEQEEKTVDANTQHLTVNMEVDNKALSEVVVTGYGKTVESPATVVAAKPGIGSKAYRKYLEENIRYTSVTKKGRVVVQATVSPTGTLQNLQVVRSLCPSCDEEALRLIKNGPAWKPATQNGSSIEKQVRIVVRFHPEKKN